MPDGIKNIIYLLLENRSFDHVLGSLKKANSDVEGVDENAPRENSWIGQTYKQTPGSTAFLKFDPRHEHEHVVVQLAGGNAGFVADYAQAYPKATRDDYAKIMEYRPLNGLPAIHALAQNFTICDHWYASVPGPTWCNRLFALSGTSLGRVAMPDGIMNLNLHWYDQPTIFDRLNEKSISWKVYAGDFPLSFLFTHQWEAQNTARYRQMTEFYRDVALYGTDAERRNGYEGLPQFSFIEPSYCDPSANDAHPPHDMSAADVLVASIYNAIRSNEKLWSETLLIIGFDEHGGFYDHVVPPAATPPDYHDEEYDFKQYGVRVPFILVSPWVGKGVLHDPLDHTSVLKYLIGKWRLGPLGYRTENAATFAPAILGNARALIDTPPQVNGPLPSAVHDTPRPIFIQLNDHLAALVALSHVLESMAGEDASVIAARARHILTGPQSQMDAAIDRVESFIHNIKHKV